MTAPPSNVMIPLSKRRFLATLQWIAVVATGLFMLMALVWPPASWPGQSINMALGFLALLLAALLLLMNVSPPPRTIFILGGLHLLFLIWSFWRTAASPLPAQAAEWFSMHLQGGWLFLIGLVLARPLALALPEQLSRNERRAIKLGRQETPAVSRLPEPTLDRLLRIWLLIFVILGVYAALYAVYHAFVTFDQVYDELLRQVGQRAPTQRESSMLFNAAEKRAVGHFGNPNIFCAFLAFTLPAIFGLLTRAREKWEEWVLAGAAGVLWYAGALSNSRGGLLCLLLATGMGCWILGRKGLARRWLPLLTAAGAALLLTLLIRPRERDKYPYLSPADSAAAKTEQAAPAAGPRKNLLARLAGSETIRERTFYWRSAWSMIREKPLAGHGFGTYGLRYQRHKILQAQEVTDAHNVVMQLGVEAGAGGAALFLAWPLGLALLAYRQRKRFPAESAHRPVFAALCGMLAVFFFDGLFDMSYSPTFRQFYYAACLAGGLLAALIEAAAPDAAYEWRTPWIRRPLPLAMLAVSLASAALFWPKVLRPAQAYEYVKLADDLVGVKEFDEAFRYLRKAEAVGPSNYAIYSKLSALRRNEGKLSDARLFIERAIETSPESAQLWTEKGRLALRAEDYEEAEAALRKATELYPLKSAYHGILADVFATQKKWTPALAAAQRQLETASHDEARASALGHLAELHEQKGDRAKAVDYLQRAIEVAPPRQKPRHRQRLRELEEATAAA